MKQKIGQLFIIGFDGKILTSELERFIKTLHPGGIILFSRNIESEEQLTKLIKGLQDISISDTGLPLFVATDQEGGLISRIPFLKEKTAQSEIQNNERAYKIGFERGEELKEVGINLNFAPVLDMAQPGDFIYSRTFQKNSEITGEFAKSIIKGQKDAGILTVIKHFPGYGGISFNPEKERLPIMDKISEISQFKVAAEAEPEMVMTANVVYDEINEDFPLTLSSEGINFVKNFFDNNPLIISDDLSSLVLKEKFSLKNAVIFSFQSGVNIMLLAAFDEPKDAFDGINYLTEAVKEEKISQKEIDEMVLKIIKLKQKMVK